MPSRHMALWSATRFATLVLELVTYYLCLSDSRWNGVSHSARGRGGICGERQHGEFYVPPPPFSLAKVVGKSKVFICLKPLTLPLQLDKNYPLC